MDVSIRPERADDAAVIRSVTQAAFRLNSHSSGTEGAIIDALREAGVLMLSLVAVTGDAVVGHIAFSPVTIDGDHRRWFGLGPVAVRPDLHGRGIGGALIREGLARLRQAGAKGCVLAGDPDYYRRFGFAHDPGLRYADVPAEYFMRLMFDEPAPTGQVRFHAGFDAR
ncbi:MAG: GNAT family N-acetyltransferase [Alphaproteobacteria bacterium HGW-Alphaproteobacteria-13]|jgi:putative acetyltransferase|nr:MAG: GNAT family N-acetyltransferase [Alphaproteobacteria bacterium HGW-Alphaproteobacteria-13]